MPLPPHIRRRKPNPLAGQVLGVYKGPQRQAEAPNLTPYRRRLLQAIADCEVKLGTGVHTGAFRWHSFGSHSTVTKAVTPFIRCGWAAVGKGKALELTEAGKAALGKPAPTEASP